MSFVRSTLITGPGTCTPITSLTHHLAHTDLTHVQLPGVPVEDKPSAEESPLAECPPTHTPPGSAANLDSSYSMGHLMQHVFHASVTQPGGGGRWGETGHGTSAAMTQEEQPHLRLPRQQAYNTGPPASQLNI